MPTITVRADAATIALAKEALAIQDACNLCGLAQRFAKVNSELIGHAQCTGTTWRNQHPVIKLWIDKFQHLARLPQSYGGGLNRADATAAYAACERLAAGLDVEWPIADL
jgi:hypothetical protein